MHVPTKSMRHVQTACLVAGVAAFAVSAVMAWKFGVSMSVAHGFGLVVACFTAAVIVPMRKWITGFGVSRRSITAATAFFLCLEFLSHLGYTFGMRDKLSVEAGAQTVAYQAVQANLASDKANIEMWRQQLADLRAQSPWAGTVKADGMRAELKTLHERIEEEKKGKRGRRAGCGQECEALQNKANGLSEKIAVAERAEDIEKQIAATQRVLDDKVGTATKTKVGHSVAKAQTEAFAEIGLLFTTLDGETAFGKGDKSIATKVADIMIGTMMAIGATLAPSVLLYFAFFAPPGSAQHTPPPVSEIGNRTSDTRAYPPIDITPPRETTRTIVRTDEHVWRDLRRALQVRPA